jgi:hypothetical protein
MSHCFRNVYCIICKYQSSLITLYVILLNYTYIWVKTWISKSYINENKEVKNNVTSIKVIATQYTDDHGWSQI